MATGSFRLTVDSKKLEHGCRMIHAGVPSFCGLRLEDDHVPTLWLLLQNKHTASLREVLVLVCSMRGCSKLGA